MWTAKTQIRLESPLDIRVILLVLLCCGSIIFIVSSLTFHTDYAILNVLFFLAGEIHAVRDLCLSRLDLDQLGFTALKTFLHLNSCLTNLRLIFVGWKSAPVYNGYPAWNHAEDSQAPDLLWISVLESLMENKVLKSVSLWHLELATNGEKLFLTMTLCDFLNRIRTLQTLKLVGCCIPEDLGTFLVYSELDKNNKMMCAQQRLRIQPWHLPGLLRVLAVCLKKPWVFGYA